MDKPAQRRSAYGSCKQQALNRVVMTLVVGLREHGRDGDLTGIGSDHRATARVESAEHRSRRQALF